MTGYGIAARFDGLKLYKKKAWDRSQAFKVLKFCVVFIENYPIKTITYKNFKCAVFIAIPAT